MHGQGALEYLIIIAAVLGITAVVVVFLTGAFSGSSAGADLSKCRLAAANCQRDITFGLGTACMYCETACEDAAGKDLLDGTTGTCGLACQQCKTGSLVSEGSEQGVGLVGYWKFDERNGSIAVDSSGQGNAGALSGANRTSQGMSGNALRFDGYDDKVEVLHSTSLYLKNKFSVEAWATPLAQTGTLSPDLSLTVVAKGKTGWNVPFNGFYMYYRNQAWGFNTANDTTQYGTSFADNAVGQPFRHVAFTFDNGTIKGYLNGQLKGTWTATFKNIDSSFGALRIGEYSWAGGIPSDTYHNFNGTIDEVRVYDRALSADEITAHASLLPYAPDYTLVGRWDIEENGGSTIYDLSGYGNDCRILGAPAWASGKVAGSALLFDGIDDYANCGNNSAFNSPNSITLSAWIRPTGWKLNTYAGIIHKMNSVESLGGCGTNYALAMSWWNQVPDFFVATVGGGTCQHFQGSGVLQNNTWYHFAATYDSVTMQGKMYINGVQVGAISYPPGNIAISHYPVTLGLGGNYFNGTIDNARVYNRALSQAEIINIYNG